MRASSWISLPPIWIVPHVKQQKDALKGEQGEQEVGKKVSKKVTKGCVKIEAQIFVLD